MKSFLFFTAIILLAVSASFAVIRVVDNNPANFNAYPNAQAAHDAASNGDTIYVIGSGNLYGALTTSKLLYWVGPGYFLGTNPETQANQASAKLSGLNVNTGSAGSVFSGLEVQGLVTINANNLVIRRCYILINVNSTIVNFGDVSNVTIEQCFFTSQGPGAYLIHVNAAQHVTIRNCYLYSVNYLIWGNSNAGDIQIWNNVLNGNIWVSNNCNFVNNILRSGAFSPEQSSYSYNIGSSSQFGTSNGNQSNVSMNTVFLNTGSPDGMYRLSETSPARGAGLNGTDCGMFGGDTPYVLSGLPSIPAIYFFDAPTSGGTTSGLPVQIRAKSH